MKENWVEVPHSGVTAAINQAEFLGIGIRSPWRVEITISDPKLGEQIFTIEVTERNDVALVTMPVSLPLTRHTLEITLLEVGEEQYSGMREYECQVFSSLDFHKGHFVYAVDSNGTFLHFSSLQAGT